MDSQELPPELLVERDGPVLNLTLARPRKANALSASLVEELLAALEEAGRDETRIAIFRGEGRHFCAGFDLGDLDQQSDGDLVLKLIRIETLLQAVRHAPFVTLALAHGKIIGAGCDLFCACSTRVATPDAMFRMPGWRFGVALGTRRLVERAGADAARSLLLDSRSFAAEEGLRLGVVNTLAETRDWPATVETETARARALDPIAQRHLLELTASDTRAADMAALVMSASRPGIRDRIRAFRAGN